MSLVTPLGKVLGLGTAKSGAEHWWAQRLTAAALVPLGIWFAIALIRMPSFAYADVVAWLSMPITAVLLLLTVATIAYHSYLGLQVVFEDYVQGSPKVIVLILSAFAHVFLLVTAAFAILKVAFGAGP
jgi:succinate dehydrogenase membrane anchor subunit